MLSRIATTAAADRDTRPEFMGRVFTGERPLTNAEREMLWRWRLANHRSANEARFSTEDAR